MNKFYVVHCPVLRCLQDLQLGESTTVRTVPLQLPPLFVQLLPLRLRHSFLAPHRSWLCRGGRLLTCSTTPHAPQSNGLWKLPSLRPPRSFPIHSCAPSKCECVQSCKQKLRTSTHAWMRMQDLIGKCFWPRHEKH